MKFTVVQITLISLILVMAVGVFFFASACGVAGMSSLFGMRDCPTSIVHHISVFVLILTATVIVMEVLTVGLMQVSAATVSNRKIMGSGEDVRLSKIKEERSDSAFDVARQLLVRRTRQRRDDSDHNN